MRQVRLKINVNDDSTWLLILGFDKTFSNCTNDFEMYHSSLTTVHNYF